jgi:hypothetical protein
MLTCSDDEGLHLIEIPDPDGAHFRGVQLSDAVTTVLNDLRLAGIEITADDSGGLLADGAIALYTSSSESDAQVEAVTAFGPGTRCTATSSSSRPVRTRCRRPRHTSSPREPASARSCWDSTATRSGAGWTALYAGCTRPAPDSRWRTTSLKITW